MVATIFLVARCKREQSGWRSISSRSCQVLGHGAAGPQPMHGTLDPWMRLAASATLPPPPSRDGSGHKKNPTDNLSSYFFHLKSTLTEAYITPSLPLEPRSPSLSHISWTSQALVPSVTTAPERERRIDLARLLFILLFFVAWFRLWTGSGISPFPRLFSVPTRPLPHFQ